MSGHILVVDDIAANLRLLDAVLSTHGYTVRTVDSGSAALAEIRGEDPPDLVLLDVQMPGMDGYDVCRAIRTDAATAHLPVVMITAAGSSEKIPALECGADDFVARPFDQAELLARVRSLLRVKRYHDTITDQAADLAAWNRVLEEQVSEQVQESRRLQRLRRFLPTRIADSVLGSDDEALLEPHQSEVAVVCCRLHGSGVDAVPAGVLARISRFQDAVGTAAARHAGTLASSNGMAAMLLFDDPTPSDAPALRAVAAAAEIRDAITAEGEDIAVSAAVTHGSATIGLVSSHQRDEYVALGDAVTQALDLSRVAAPGEILLEVSAAKLSGVETAEPVDRTAPARALVSIPVLPTPLDLDRPPADDSSDVDRRPARTAGVEVMVLGSTALVVDGVEVPLSSLRLRQLLALLVAQRDDVAPIARLVDQLWDGSPPDAAVPALRVYVSRIRKLLGGHDDRLVTRRNGYQLLLDDGVDAAAFAALAARGRASADAGDQVAAVASYRAALACWRGTAYADLGDAQAITAARAALDEDRLGVQEDLLDALLGCGRHNEAISLLETLVIEHPFRERLWAQRMTALYEAGRQPDALACFQQLRRTLADELGLEPSAELKALHQAILTGNLARHA